MTSILKVFTHKIFSSGPVIFLYFLSVTELDTEYSNFFEILSFNLQFIIIYYWTLRHPWALGNGHIFFAGVVNDIIMGLPLGTSPLSYLVVSFIASYIKQITVNNSMFTDWFTFLVAIFFSNLIYLILINKFSSIGFNYNDLFYNSFFTFLFYPLFWLIFNQYRQLFLPNKHD